MTLDTNIVIAYLEGEEAVVAKLSEWRAAGVPLLLSAVVESEVLSFSGWRPGEYERARTFLAQQFTSISFDRAIAHATSLVRQQTRLKFPDAAIAATALYTRIPLATRNIRDFKHVPGLEVITL